MVVALAAAGLLVAATFSSSGSIAAEPPGAQDPMASQSSLEDGIEAYQAGALEVAVEALSAALEGDLSGRQLAEALYFRGMAYRELGKPGQAVTDLTSAIALKNGLSKARLKDAVRNRVGALREAGIAPTESAVAVDAFLNGPPIPVPVPADRLPVPVAAGEQQPRQPDPPAASSIGAGEGPPTPKGDFVSAIEKLIPDWP